MRHCISAWGLFKNVGICDGKETMFPRIARRKIPLPGWMGVDGRSAPWISGVFRFSSIECIQESSPAEIRIA
jgi:hypothetical protein